MTAPVAERRILLALWLVLVAAVVGLFPFTIYSTFLVSVAETASADAASAGALRGLGGVAALVVGVAAAPLLGRLSGEDVAVTALAVLAACCLVGAQGSFPALVVFCFGIGASNAVLFPALLTMAAGRFADDASAARAATMVTAVQALAAVLAAPVIGVLAWWKGWQGALVVTAVIAGGVAAGFAVRRRGRRSGDSPPGYREAFRALAGRRDLLRLIGVALLRTAAFMGQLSYLAAWYGERFGLTPLAFTLVWTVSGSAFAVGNYFAGRWGNSGAVRPRTLMVAGLAAGTVALPVLFGTSLLVVALICTAVLGLAHAAVAAAVTTLIVRTGGASTSTALSVNAAAMSFGTFVGAAVGGAGLALAGFGGLGLTLAAVTACGLLLVPVRRRGRP